MKKLIAFLLVLVMVLSMVACTAKTEDPTSEAIPPAETPETPTAADDIQTPPAEEEKILNLQWHQGIGIDTVFENPWKDMQCLIPYMLFDSLLVQNSDESYTNKIASDYTVSADGLSYTFTIRDDIKWHDGTALTADDVVWSLNACVGMASPKHLLGNVAYADLTTYEPFWSNPVGCGPYVLEEVSFPDYAVLTANPDYYDAAPGIPKCLFTNYSAGGSDAVVAALIAGDLDFAWKNALNDIEVANNVTAQNSDLITVMSTSFYCRYFQFVNAEREARECNPDLAKPEVRQAFDLILNKEAIASFYSGQGVALSTFVNPTSPKYNDDIPLPKQDIDTAITMLNEAGYDFSKELVIAYYYDDQTTTDIMAMIKQDFATAGITVVPKLLTGDLQGQLAAMDFDISYAGVSGVVDPISIYDKLVSKNSANLGLVEERAAIIDPAYDAYEATINDASAKEAGDVLQALGYQNAWILPAYGLNTVQIYNANKLTIPSTMLELDNETGRNWMFESWVLN